MPEIRAAFFDFGGVILSSPFEGFAEYERRQGLPDGLIRALNSTNPDDNAWAQLERNQVSFDEFCRLYEGEAHAAGHRIDAREVMALLSGTVRPEMVGAVQRCKERLKTACLTNNFVSFDQAEDGAGRGWGPRLGEEAGQGPRREVDRVLALFDVIIESSKVGVRKPDPRFYEIACEECGVEPHEAVFLDDLGINLKPAKAMGMTTIKVVDPDQALAELEAAVGFPVR